MKKLTTEQLDRMRREQDLTLVHVLGKLAFDQEHIPGSANAPVESEDFVDRVAGLAGDRTRPVVVYCSGAQCDASPKAARKLEEAGFKQVYDYEGGLEAWKEAGKEVAEAARSA